ncbi:IS3 family transposase [Geomicrobium sediminis]|uniref:IS3 family transposase n=1 Tax=Geomicrobium sediminis TaxID=1347788 RepID=UPI003B82FF72
MKPMTENLWTRSQPFITIIKGIYGYCRITIYLRQRKGIIVNKKRVHRLMKHLGLRVVI